jgi:hypothetical protein
MSGDPSQVPINPPPWGPSRDPHFDATNSFEGYGLHSRVDVQTAILHGWWYRPAWYNRLMPDTRRCRFHGEIMFPEQELSQADLDIMYAAQNAGMATGPIG